jgi:hypothetical protein
LKTSKNVTLHKVVVEAKADIWEYTDPGGFSRCSFPGVLIWQDPDKHIVIKSDFANDLKQHGKITVILANLTDGSVENIADLSRIALNPHCSYHLHITTIAQTALGTTITTFYIITFEP